MKLLHQRRFLLMTWILLIILTALSGYLGTGNISTGNTYNVFPIAFSALKGMLILYIFMELIKGHRIWAGIAMGYISVLYLGILWLIT